MTRVLHTGDTHLGYRQYHSADRRADFLRAFRQVIEDAVSEGVDAVVHAGDFFHDRQPALADIRGAIEVLRDLEDADIPFLAVVGNHERTRDEQWLDLFETLGLATRLGREPTVVGDVAFYGLDYVPRSKRDGLDYEFEPHDAAYAALVAHGLFTPFAHADWDTETVLQESTVEFDAMLLGDNHTPDTAQVRDTWVTYCGSTERTDASERADRGYNLVGFEEGVSIARRGLETRPFVTIDLDLSPGEGIDRVRERIAEEPIQDAVVIVTIEGDGAEVPPARIEEFATDRGALIARVNDRRELETEESTEVRFADPDDAVRDRLRELGLSEAAFGLDEVVRDDTVADSNVRDRVTDRVRDLLEADTTAFTTAADVEPPAPAAGDEEPSEPATNDPPAESGADAESDGPDAADETPTGTDTPADTEAGPEPGPEDHDGSEPNEPAGSSSDTGGRDDDGDGNEEEDAAASPEQQVTMEDYL